MAPLSDEPRPAPPPPEPALRVPLAPGADRPAPGALPPQQHRRVRAQAEVAAAPPREEGSSREAPVRTGTSQDSLERDGSPCCEARSRGSPSLFSQAAEVTNPKEVWKWDEMVGAGVAEYMRAYPKRMQRRVRRGIPQCYRWQVWKARVGVLDSDPLLRRYEQLCGSPNASTKQIEVDVSRTFPEIFSSLGSQQALLRVLNAYAAHNPEVGYCQGMNFVVALLLLVSDFREEESFVVFCRLMDSPEYGLAGFYCDRFPLLWRYLRACDHLLASLVPDVRDHFIRESMQPAVYLYQWFLTLFINCLHLSIVLIIWDVIIFEGLPVILRVAVSILRVLKDSLLAMHFEDILQFFKKMKTYDGEDGGLKAARVGHLLMKHTEHVSIPEDVLRYLSEDSVEQWQAAGAETMSVDLQPGAGDRWTRSGGWLHAVSSWFGSDSSGNSASTGAGCASPSDTTAPPSLSDFL